MALTAMTLLSTGMTFTSCGDDNKEDVRPTAKTAKAQTSVYFAGDMLTLFNVTCSINGKEITLTTENTEEVTFKNETLRKYSGTENSYNSFPATYTASITSKVKDGVDLKNAEPTDYCLYISMAVSNDLGSWEKASISDFTFEYGRGVNWGKMTDNQLAKYANRTCSAEAVFEAAGKVSVSYK